jgi:hypothetical protein
VNRFSCPAGAGQDQGQGDREQAGYFHISSPDRQVSVPRYGYFNR